MITDTFGGCVWSESCIIGLLCPIQTQIQGPQPPRLLWPEPRRPACFPRGRETLRARRSRSPLQRDCLGSIFRLSITSFEILFHPVLVDLRLSVLHFDPGKHILRRVRFDQRKCEKVALTLEEFSQQPEGRIGGVHDDQALERLSDLEVLNWGGK